MTPGRIAGSRLVPSTESTRIASGAEIACTSRPASDGPAICVNAFEAWIWLFASTSRSRPTSVGTSAPRARSVICALTPARYDTT